MFAYIFHELNYTQEIGNRLGVEYFKGERIIDEVLPERMI